MFVTNWISTTKIQKISEITNFFRHYFLSRTEVVKSTSGRNFWGIYKVSYQILFRFSVEFIRTREKFFYEKSLKVSSFGLSNGINSWYIIIYKNDTFL